MTEGPFILYVEDDDDDFEALEEAFEHYCILPFVRGKEGQAGLDLLRSWAETQGQNLPHLIIVDHNMPKLNGDKLISELRKIPAYYEKPIILLSTSRTLREAEQVKNLHVRFIPKATDYQELLDMAGEITAVYCSEYKVVPKT